MVAFCRLSGSPQHYARGVGLDRARFAVGFAALGLLGWLLAGLPLGLCLALVFGIAGALLLCLRPQLGLYALAFAIPFGSLRELRLGALTVGASELLVAAVAVCWGVRLLARREVPQVARARSRLWLALLLYVATLLVSLLPAAQLLPGLKEISKWCEFLIVFQIAASLLNARQRQVLVLCLLAAGVAEGLLGIYQFARQVGPPAFVLFGRYMRAYGTFEQPNPFGGYLGLVLPLAYGLLLTGWRRVLSRMRDASSVLLWAVALIACLIICSALVMSWSRGALLGLLGGLGLVALILARPSWIPVLLVVAVIALWAPDLAAFVPRDVTDRLTDVTDLVGRDLTAVEIDDANFSNIQRLAHWVAAWRMFSRRPWLGVGTGQYALVYPQVAIPRWQEAMGHAHNYYLSVMAEGGLLGLGAYIVLMLTMLIGVWRRFASSVGWQRGLVVGATGMLGHLFFHSVVDNLYVHEIYLLVALILGLAIGSSPDLGSQPDEDELPLAIPSSQIA